MLDALHEIRARKLPVVFVLWACGLSVAMILLGLLLTRSAAHVWPISAEDGVDRYFAARRVGWANAATDALCTLANTFGAAGVALIAVIWTRWRCGRWREPLYVAFSVLLELVVFLVTTLVVHRSRPAVSELDASPPTSSFPSGHTAAAVALYGAVALLVYKRTGRGASWLLLLVPAAVGLARLYRGMHHPSDVVAGALLGAACVWAAQRRVLRECERTRDLANREHPRGPQRSPRPSPRAGADADVLIVNGSKADEDAVARLLAQFTDLCARAGRPTPRAERTTENEHGAGLARDAVAAGAGLVVACGGDGTVNEVASALAGTGVALGVVPLGTGNLLAANLGIPTTLEDALNVLVDGAERRIDVGRAHGRIFLGMTGMGLDAAMIADAPEGLKRRAGWAAYAVAVARHLPDRIAAVSVQVDGRRSRHRNVSMLLIGNIGRLQAGIEPLPGAEVDDGLLDLAVIAPRGALGWFRAGAALRRGRGADGDASRTVYRDRGERINVRTRHPAPREADGETLPAATRLDVEVWHDALTIRVPRPRLETSADTRVQPGVTR
jgi:diacylglycerol kinase family enzyme/membrane-associated phospholipid phosphatase